MFSSWGWTSPRLRINQRGSRDNHLAAKELYGVGRLDRAPQPLRCGRHLHMADTEVGERVDERIGHRRHRADAAGFARALDAERIGLGRHWIALDLDRADVGRPR